MSAYIVEKDDIGYLMVAAMRYKAAWYDENGELHRIGHGDYQAACEAGNMLWRENIKSVSYRYPGDKTSANLPGKIGEVYELFPADLHGCAKIEPVQVLASCSHYSYQSCEHPGWEDSPAHHLIERIRAAAIRRLPGYADTAWGAPDSYKNIGKGKRLAA